MTHHRDDRHDSGDEGVGHDQQNDGHSFALDGEDPDYAARQYFSRRPDAQCGKDDVRGDTERRADHPAKRAEVGAAGDRVVTAASQPKQRHRGHQGRAYRRANDDRTRRSPPPETQRYGYPADHDDPERHASTEEDPQQISGTGMPVLVRDVLDPVALHLADGVDFCGGLINFVLRCHILHTGNSFDETEYADWDRLSRVRTSTLLRDPNYLGCSASHALLKGTSGAFATPPPICRPDRPAIPMSRKGVMSVLAAILSTSNPKGAPR